MGVETFPAVGMARGSERKPERSAEHGAKAKAETQGRKPKLEKFLILQGFMKVQIIDHPSLTHSFYLAKFILVPRLNLNTRTQF